MSRPLGVWFPTVRTNTGSDIFTERLVKGLNESGIRAAIAWLPLRAEYAPWTVSVSTPPKWANVVHVNTWLHPRFIPQNVPLVATIHHASHHRDTFVYKGPLRKAYHNYLIIPRERRVMRRANKVIAVSQFVAETARQTLADVPISVVYNGVDTSVFAPGNRISKPNEPFRLLFVGSWKMLKGVDLLAPIMRELGADFELYYTGGLAAEKDKLDMPSNMHDIGRLKGDAEIVHAMQSADALLFPSRCEGFGLVAVEAMACGIPVITTRCSSLAEIVLDGVTGQLCAPNDVAAFVSAARLLANKNLDVSVLQNHVKKRFSMQKNLREYMRIYNDIAIV